MTAARALPLLVALALVQPAFGEQAPQRPAPREAPSAGATRPPDDNAITARVEEELRRLPGFDPADVRVQTYAGSVRLMGWVDHAGQKGQAAQAARSVPGVVEVQNSLEVK